ncbi:GNAT family N-acetyltransferase [Streptacidiphilus rugosus]|uniref:GNAT family N-acetyltransferase n=1 Tax=Streptacidiphilus rugosus TaxID=405783 RepID=UPI00068FAA4B|nr:GNAT family N-acetyltransferase [Streptacidiphilus rugosus]
MKENREPRADRIEVRVAHTAELDARDLAEARALLYRVFDDMAEDDWEHSLGGMHALVREGGLVVAHASVVQRRMVHRGRAWRVGYVEGVGVERRLRRQGYGAAVMAALEGVIARGYDFGALAATDEAMEFYASRGWRRWQGPTSALTPAGIVRTEDADDCLFVLQGDAPLDRTGELTCDWRDGDVW